MSAVVFPSLTDRIEDLTDPQDPRIAPFRYLKGSARELLDRGIIVVEGEQQIERLLTSELRVNTLFLERPLYDRWSQLLDRSDVAGAKLFAADKGVMAEIVGYRLHRGALALAERPAPVPLELLPTPMVALYGINDPENVGAIVRSAALFGISSFVVDEDSCDPFMRRAIRVSMGAAFSIDVGHCASLVDTIALFQKRGLRVVGIEDHPRAVLLPHYEPKDNTVFILGNERRGIPDELLRKSDEVVSIPTTSHQVSSLNVAAAAAIVFSRHFELLQLLPRS